MIVKSRIDMCVCPAGPFEIRQPVNPSETFGNATNRYRRPIPPSSCSTWKAKWICKRLRRISIHLHTSRSPPWRPIDRVLGIPAESTCRTPGSFDIRIIVFWRSTVWIDKVVWVFLLPSPFNLVKFFFSLFL